MGTQEKANESGLDDQIREVISGPEELAALRTLGIEGLSDFSFVKETDFTAAGLTVVQARKLLAVAQSLQTNMGHQDSTVGFDTKRISGEAASMAHARSGGDLQGILQSNAETRSRSRERRLHSEYWQSQTKGRPQRLIFVRHGESEGNVNRAITRSVPDHALHLTGNGRQHALHAGKRLKEIIGDESVTFIVSPYTRTLETMNGIFRGLDREENPPWREDVRIREQEHGNFDSPQITNFHRQKQIFGPFYYRFPEGESQADCYDRASSFYESLYRSWVDNTFQNQVIVCHGMMILVMLMRLMRLPIYDFERLEPLSYCEFVVMERPPTDAKFQISYTWEHDKQKDHRGLRVKPEGEWVSAPEVWSGDPAAPLFVSKAHCDYEDSEQR
mmetsp:Transcript_3684/g.9359  ORF Transcript_3684/g.9359 Transcript_3684/m.9359 type:complete len:388 (+) Transcript_3684:72-1235(+)